MVIIEAIKLLSLILVLSVSIANSNAQTSDDMRKAFKDSYEFEAKQDFYNSIDALKKLNNNDYETNLRLGWLHYLNQQYKESMGYYQSCIDSKPGSIEAKLGYTYPAAALNDWDNVAKQYNDILSIDPNNTQASYKLGMIYYYKPDYQTALKYFVKVSELYPFDFGSILMIGWSNLKLGNVSAAKTYFNKSLLIKPDDPSALEGLGLLR
ncbi:MAG: hypothetical protein EHM58_09205 [Ignavibacteriae bacterium]|nr:MAG: hypothetical protein EHM58_09205 [Ignavibacteriota bacterium]